jgi:hypothetical protein
MNVLRVTNTGSNSNTPINVILRSEATKKPEEVDPSLPLRMTDPIIISALDVISNPFFYLTAIFSTFS